MKLHAKDIFLLQRGGKFRLKLGGGAAGILNRTPVRMGEIKITAVGNSLEQSRAAVAKADLVPSYVQRARRLCEASALAGENPQPLSDIVGRAVQSAALTPLLVTNRFVPMRYRNDLPLAPDQIVPLDLISELILNHRRAV